MKRIYLISSLMIAAGLGAILLLSRTTNDPILHPAGPVAAGERHVLLFTLALSSTIVLPVFFLLFYFAWRYHAKATDVQVHHRPNWDHENPWIEFSWWIPPAIIIAILAVVAWRSSHALDPYVPLPGETLEVQVVALEWKWLFIYPDLGVATVNELDIPVGRPVHFSLTARAPMNSFWIPSLAGQIMVMPGMQSQLNLLADREGVFDGYSGNLSGEGFSGMHFKVHAMQAPAYDSWAAALRAGQARILDTQSFRDLSRPSLNDPARFYTSVAPGLYTSLYGTSSPDSMHM